MLLLVLGVGAQYPTVPVRPQPAGPDEVAGGVQFPDETVTGESEHSRAGIEVHQLVARITAGIVEVSGD